jgi:hypothetical protein
MTKQKTPYDYRRYIFLVQFIASNPTEEQIIDLCSRWGIDPIDDYIDGARFILVDTTYAVLAQSVIEYHTELDKNEV